MPNYLNFIVCSVALTISCGINDKESSTSVAENVKGSNCGGFELETNLSKRAIDTPEYCKAERLLWSYNESGHILSILCNRIIANCAAKLTVLVSKNADTLDFTLKDNIGDVIANCICPFDVSCDIPGITGDNIYILIKKELFLINLNELHGELIIDTSITESHKQEF